MFSTCQWVKTLNKLHISIWHISASTPWVVIRCLRGINPWIFDMHEQKPWTYVIWWHAFSNVNDYILYLRKSHHVIINTQMNVCWMFCVCHMIAIQEDEEQRPCSNNAMTLYWNTFCQKLCLYSMFNCQDDHGQNIKKVLGVHDLK